MYLNCHSHFSLRYGTLSPMDLFLEAKQMGVNKLALTDINNTSCYIELLRLSAERKEEHELSLALGIEFHEAGVCQFIGIAQNHQGFEELNRYLSHCNQGKTGIPSLAPIFENTYIIYPYSKIGELPYLRENEFVGVTPWEIGSLILSSKFSIDKYVALATVNFKRPTVFQKRQGRLYHREFERHSILRAINENNILSRLERSRLAAPESFFLKPTELEHYYDRHPGLLHRASWLLESCHHETTLYTDKNKQYFSLKNQDLPLSLKQQADRELLRKLSHEGLLKRFRRPNKDAIDRVAHELKVIALRGFEAYFLICWDVIRYARHKNYSYVGRGSGANSLVAYCLGLTNVDPIALDLYFERFLNPERSSPPDFDLDFSWKDRDDVIRYMFEKHGDRHTALLGTHVTFQQKATIRELGKVFGLPKSEIDQLIQYPDALKNKDHITQSIFHYAAEIQDMPNYLSIHAGGVVISQESIHQYTATEFPPKSFPVTHFEMHNAEDIGLYKFDILSQRGLGHIKDCVAIVSENKGEEVSIDDVDRFMFDEKIKELMRQGRCMGCFYVESPAMRMLLGKLSCEDYLTLVAASSIIRSGVASSGMMRTYIERHHSQGNYESIHPLMDELMQETYGVMVYQEDVIKVAHHFAGLRLAESDILRRGMSGKFRSRAEFRRVKEAFFYNCKQRGYADQISNRVWYEIESFSGYSFSKGHSASYAVESYQSLYLKAHYPLEFMVAVINNFGGFYRTEFYLHEARMHGAKIVAPCINNSAIETTIKGAVIHLGFVHIKSLEHKISRNIVDERQAHGPFESLDDFYRRLPINIEQLRILIKIGAFNFTGQHKRVLLWQGYMYGKHKRKTEITGDLFITKLPVYHLPHLEHDPIQDAYDEIELLGFPLCNPFSLLKPTTAETTMARDLRRIVDERVDKRVHLIGYLVTTKSIRTKKGAPMFFGTFYDREGYVFDTTHFPNVSKTNPFRGGGFYRIFGKVVTDFGYPMVEVSKMIKLPMLPKEGESAQDKDYIVVKKSFRPSGKALK